MIADLADVFAIQSEIAKAIADQLQAKLSPSREKCNRGTPHHRYRRIRTLQPGKGPHSQHRLQRD